MSNAQAQYSSTNFGAIVTYICNPGYTLSGASTRTCRANGKWDGVGPNCSKLLFKLMSYIGQTTKLLSFLFVCEQALLFVFV